MTNRREHGAFTSALFFAFSICGSATLLRAQNTKTHLIQEIGWEISNGYTRSALADAKRGALEYPDSPTLEHLLAVAEAENGMREKARKSFQKAIRMDRTVPQNYYDLALLDMQDGNYAEATSMIRTYLQILPQSGKARLMLGIAYRKQGQDQLAIAQFKQAIAASPDLPLAHYNMGKIYQSEGHNKAALAEYRKELGVNPQFYGVYWSAGYAELAENNINSAEALFQRGTQLRPLAYQAYFGLARVYLKQNNLTKAESELKTVIALAPEDVNAHSLLASVYTRLGKTLQANREELVVETLKSQAKQAKVTPAKSQ